MIRPIHEHRVLTFDCYGTLIDWEQGIWDALQPLLLATDTIDLSRAAALEAFGLAESRQQTETPGMRYPELLERVHRSLADRLGLTSTPALDAAFGASVAHWPAFPDTAEALRELKKTYKLVILSNVDKQSFAASNRKLGVSFDAIYTAEEIGSYKPARANFAFMLERLERDLGLQKADVLHTAQSMHHDHVPAASMGLATAWIDRQRLSEGGSWGATRTVGDCPTTDFLFFSLTEMAEAVAASKRG